MNLAAGSLLIAGSLAVVALGVWAVRPRGSRAAFVATLIVAGVGLGLGGLCFQEDVGILAWFLTPAIMAVLTVAHTLAMVAGTGPLRT